MRKPLPDQEPSNTGFPDADNRVEFVDRRIASSYHWDANTLEKSIQDLEKLLSRVRRQFENAETDKKKWDSVVEQAMKLQKSLESYLMSTEGRKFAGMQSIGATQLDTKWFVPSSTATSSTSKYILKAGVVECVSYLIRNLAKVETGGVRIGSHFHTLKANGERTLTNHGCKWPSRAS